MATVEEGESTNAVEEKKSADAADEKSADERKSADATEEKIDPTLLTRGVVELETRLTCFIQQSFNAVNDTIVRQKRQIDQALEKFESSLAQSDALLRQIVHRLDENSDRLQLIDKEQLTTRETVEQVTGRFASMFPQLIGTNHPKPSGGGYTPRSNPNSVPLYTPLRTSPPQQNEPDARESRLVPAAFEPPSNKLTCLKEPDESDRKAGPPAFDSPPPKLPEQNHTSIGASFAQQEEIADPWMTSAPPLPPQKSASAWMSPPKKETGRPWKPDLSIISGAMSSDEPWQKPKKIARPQTPTHQNFLQPKFTRRGGGIYSSDEDSTDGYHGNGVYHHEGKKE